MKPMKFFVTSNVVHRTESGKTKTTVACGYTQATSEAAAIGAMMVNIRETNPESDGYFGHQVFVMQVEDRVILEAAEDIKNAQNVAPNE